MRYDDISSGNPLSGSSTMADAEGGPAAGGQVRLAQAGEIDAQSLLEEGREAAGNETAENEVAENGEADEVVRQVILAREGEVVVLPVGTSIDEIEIRDDDIVLVQPDGSIIIIENGVAMVPTIQIGDVEIPAETLAAVIEGIAVAAGPEGGDGVLGSGGNFFVQPGDIGDPFPISPLLPPTELGFPELEDEEILQPLAEDEEVPGVAPPPPSLITPSLTAGSSVNHNETPGIQWSVNPSHDVAFDDLPEDIQGIFGDFGETEPLFGEDPHVPEEKMDAFGAIGFAWSYDEELNPGPQVVVSPPEGGVEPITRTFALQTEDGTFSGLFTTEGVPIFLFNGPDGLILGRLGSLPGEEVRLALVEEGGSDGPSIGLHQPDPDGEIAFALIAWSPDGGESIYFISAQWLSLYHDDTDDVNELAFLADGTVQLVVTDTDSVGQEEGADMDVSGLFGFRDDGPNLDLSANEDGDERLLSLVMDESVVDDPSTDEDDPDQVSNAGIDDVEDNGGFRTFDPANMTSDVSGLEDTEFGHKTTQSDALAGLFDIPETFDFGSDGPASEDPVSYQFSLVLNGQDDNGGVATGLKVTAVAGTALADLEDHERTIWLFEEDGKIVGRVGETSADAETGLIALVIELEGADTDNPTLSVKQYIPIQHDETDQHDEPALMTLAEGGSLALKLDLEITDGDGDTESGSAEYVLADHSGSFLTIEDDGPRTIGGLEVEATVFEGAIIPGGTGEHPEDPDPFQSTASSVLAGSLLALVAFGTDGAHASEAFSFNVDLSKLEDQALTSGGEELVYSVSSEGADVAIGYDVVLIATKGSADGEVVFRLHLNHTSGDWLFELVGGLDHEAPPAGTADYNELVVDFSDVIVARDGDGDTISLDADSFAIAIVDDVPVAGEDVQTLVLANTLENFGSASLDIDFGADGFGALVLTKAMGADGTQVDLMHGNGVYGVVTNGDGTSEVQQLSSGGIPLVWRDNGDGTWSAVREGTQDDDAPAPSAFTVTLNSDGTYTVEMDGDNPIALDATKTTFTLDFTTGGISGGNDDQLIFFDSDPSDATIMVLVTSNEENVNSSVQGMGVGNNFINTGQIMRLDFGDPVDPDLIDGADDDDFVYQYISTSTIELNSLGNNDEALVEVVLESGESVYFRIPGSGSGNVKNSLLIQQGVEGEGAVTGDGTEGDPYELTIVDGQAVAYVDEHFATLYFSGDGYRLLSAQGSDFSEESLDISTSFTVDAIDFDGDYATTEFDVKFKSGNEITGTEGSDVIVGNPDQTESLIGLEGDDVFVLNSFDFHDIIVDYDFNNSLGLGSDVIDITQLLELYNADNADVDAETFIQSKVELDGDQLLVDTNGDGAHDTLVAKITTAPTHVAFMIDGQTYDESGNLIA